MAFEASERIIDVFAVGIGHGSRAKRRVRVVAENVTRKIQLLRDILVRIESVLDGACRVARQQPGRTEGIYGGYSGRGVKLQDWR